MSAYESCNEMTNNETLHEETTKRGFKKKKPTEDKDLFH